VELEAEPETQPAPTSIPTDISRYSQNIWRRAIPAAAAVFVVALLASLFAGPLNPHRQGTAPQATATSLPFVQQIHTLAPSELMPGAAITDVQMLSRDEGWAIGGGSGPKGCTDNIDGTCQSLLLHLTGGRWQEVGPALPNVWLATLSLASRTEGWAGGLRSDSARPSITPVFLHYSQGHWIEVQVPEMGQGEVFKIQMLSADDGWAIVGRRGAAFAQGPMVLWHYTAGKWTLVPAAESWVVTLSMLSPTEGWAAGTSDILR
jgi:hypothetical protein